MSAGEPVRRVIFRDFPRATKLLDTDDPRDGWRLSRLWGGYPDLEWTFGIFRERISALEGIAPAYFYEDLTWFETARRLIRIGSVLLSRNVPTFPSVGLGFDYFDSAYRSIDGRLTDGAPFRGRHAVATIDHEDENEIRFPNSWNPPYWGDSGFGYITRGYFEKHVDAVLTRWSAAGGPSQALNRCMERETTLRLPEEERFVHCWAEARNVFWTQQVSTDTQTFTMLNWVVYSMDTGGPVEVIEVRDGDEAVGRAHCFLGDEPTLRELFVLPTRRREGIGTLITETAAQWMRDMGYSDLRAWLREADARQRVIGGPLALAASLGASWEDVAMRRPNVVKIARRRL